MGDRLVRWRIDAGMDVSAGDLLATAPLRPGRRPAGGVAGARAWRSRAATTGRHHHAGRGHGVAGRSDDAAALLGGLPSGSARERCRREVDLALVLAFGLNRSRDGAERLELLLDDVDDDQWGYVAGQIPLMWLLAGEIHEARRAAEDVLADARSSGADRLSAELVLIPALNLLGLPVSALDRATGVLPRVADHPAFNEYMVGQLETAVPTGHRYAGDLDMAEQVGLQMYERVTQQGAALLRGVYALRLGQIALWRGALARAEQWFLEAGGPGGRCADPRHRRRPRPLHPRADRPVGDAERAGPRCAVRRRARLPVVRGRSRGR